MNELRAGEPYTIGTVTLVPIERIYIHCDRGKMGYRLTGFKEPHAVVICDTKGIHAFNTEAEEISLDLLIQVVPNLKASLAYL